MYTPFGKVIFRFPHYSVETLHQALNEEEMFQEILQSPSFEKAIFFASPVLYDELQNYKSGKLNAKDAERVKNSILRYLARMSTRCTPFGLFASCATGTIGEETKVRLSDELDMHVRLDMLYLCVLSQELVKIEEIKKNVRYFVNSTLYSQGSKLRYIEYKFNTQQRVYQLVEITTNSYLNSLLKSAYNGITYQGMIQFLTDLDEEIDEETAAAYVNSIIDNQIFVSEIDPIVTGEDFFTQIMEIIQKLQLDSTLYQDLQTLQELLVNLNNPANAENTIAICNEIEEVIKKINIPYQKKFLLQVDSFRKMEEVTVGTDIISDLQNYLTFLNKITVAGDIPTLSDFKKTFHERYEEREIPLLEVLDPDLGIGYPSNQMNDPSPLLEGLALPRQQGGTGTFSSVVAPLHTILQKKIWNFNPQTDKEIVFTDEDVKHLNPRWDDLPATLHSSFHIVGNSSDQHNYQLFSSHFSGSSAANLLGRFAYCNKEVRQLVEDITNFEKEFYKDYIVAEISHIPDSRVGNILARPSLREYEILYLANSTRNRNELIYPSDILVSIKNNQVMLRSKSLNRNILPRLTTAHNYKNNPTPIYRFLCDLQLQGIRGGLYFDWGTLQNQLDYLPRVRYQNIIVSLSKWRIDVKSMEQLLKQKNEQKLQEEVREWRNKKQLPRYVSLADGDNTLFVDLENLNSIQAFLSILNKRDQIMLEEFIEESQPLIRDNKGKYYSNECVIPFYNSSK